MLLVCTCVRDIYIYICVYVAADGELLLSSFNSCMRYSFGQFIPLFSCPIFPYGCSQDVVGWKEHALVVFACHILREGMDERKGSRAARIRRWTKTRNNLSETHHQRTTTLLQAGLLLQQTHFHHTHTHTHLPTHPLTNTHTSTGTSNTSATSKC